jgi:hypothetical protein
MTLQAESTSGGDEGRGVMGSGNGIPICHSQRVKYGLRTSTGAYLGASELAPPCKIIQAKPAASGED